MFFSDEQVDAIQEENTPIYTSVIDKLNTWSLPSLSEGGKNVTRCR